MISEEQILKRIEQYKTNLRTETDPVQRLYFNVRIAELEFVLDKPKITYQIIGGTPEAKEKIEATIRQMIQSLENL